MAISFGGLISGLDTNAIIDKLISVEKLPIRTLQKRKSDANTQISTLGDLASKLQALKTQLTGIKTTAGLSPLSATSTDATRVTASVTGTPAAGVYSVSITTLARAQSNKSLSYASDTAGIAGAGSLFIQVGAGAPVQVDYTGADTLTAIANRINSNVSTVTAAVVNTGSDYRLTVTSKSTGTANALQFASNVGMTIADGLGLSANVVQSADNAVFTVNGLALTRSSNTVTDAVTGMTLQLQSVTPGGGAATNITVASDQAALQTKIKGFVDAYNAVATVLKDQLTYSGVKKGTDTLFADPTARSLQLKMQSTISTSYVYNGGGSFESAKRIGITTNSDGTLAFDADKFSAALATDSNIVKNLFLGTGANGLTAALTSVADLFSDPISGSLQSVQTSRKKLIKSYDDQIQRIEDAAVKMEERLRSQFAAMERAISQYQAQGNSLMGLSNAGQQR